MHTELLQPHQVIFSVLPTADQHEVIFMYGGFSDSRQYRYWDPVTRDVDFDGMIQDLLEAPQNSVIVLQACAHNPTGCDLTKEQWIKVADVMRVRRRCVLTETFFVFCHCSCGSS
jgi:Aspartate/tyrosine/aromatic aminotransferase